MNVDPAANVGAGFPRPLKDETKHTSMQKRKRLRLKDYDYSGAGAYFVSVCTQERKCGFGEVVEGKMRLNESGRMVKKWWEELENKFPSIETDEFIVMPNHIHGIITIVGADPCVRPQTNVRQNTGHGPTHRSAPTLGRMIQWFKTMTTNGYIHGVQEKNWPAFSGKLWQRNYYERVIRNETELFETRQYIQENPLKWDLDPENPLRRKHG